MSTDPDKVLFSPEETLMKTLGEMLPSTDESQIIKDAISMAYAKIKQDGNRSDFQANYLLFVLSALIVKYKGPREEIVRLADQSRHPAGLDHPKQDAYLKELFDLIEEKKKELNIKD